MADLIEQNVHDLLLVGFVVGVVGVIVGLGIYIKCRGEGPAEKESDEAVTPSTFRKGPGEDYSNHTRAILPKIKTVCCNVGINFNEWKKPLKKFGYGENSFQMVLRDLECIGDFDINERDWDRATRAVDVVLEWLLHEVKDLVQKKNYECLSVQKWVRQGSSREGLKVREATEFDAILQFDLTDFDIRVVQIYADLGLLRVMATPEIIRLISPRLWEKGVFITDNENRCYISSKRFHETIFESLIDSAVNTLEQKLNRPRWRDQLSFSIKRRINQPSVNITINVTEKTDGVDGLEHIAAKNFVTLESKNSLSCAIYYIDVDIVPGILIAMDKVPDPLNVPYLCSMHCPRYAVFKWVQDNQSGASDIEYPHHVWRICSSGYEKHILDVCSLHDEQMYLITALRIMKTYFSKAKELDIQPQLVTVLRSYHLKMVTFYCILYLTIINKKDLFGVREALAYFLAFLEVCLEEERLPNFFQGNGYILYMFPDYHYKIDDIKVNMFKGYERSMVQVRKSFKRMKQELAPLNLPEIIVDYVEKFREYIRNGCYA